MTIKDAAFKVEDLKLKAWSITSLLLMLSSAISHGNWDASAYEGAIYAMMIAARELECDADALTEDLFASARAAREDL